MATSPIFATGFVRAAAALAEKVHLSGWRAFTAAEVERYSPVGPAWWGGANTDPWCRLARLAKDLPEHTLE
eukprot:8692091-Alexandrium_andersonii.AAC.1